MTDEPMLQCQPGPTDAELQAERDARHRIVVEEWMSQNTWAFTRDNTEVACAKSYMDGWYAAFEAAQKELAGLIEHVTGIQKFALIMAAERLSLLANGRAVPLQ